MADIQNELAAPYLEVAIGSVNQRNNVIHYKELPSLVEANRNTEVFRSYYFYDKSRLEHEGPAKDYMGKRYVNDLHLDYDGEDALDRTRNIFQKLVGLGVDEDAIWIWFSGNKGFHVWIPDVFGFSPGSLVYQDVRQTLVDFAPGVDTKPMAQNGLIRADWSYHAKSGLYKTPLTKRQLMEMDIDGIRKMAALSTSGSWLGWEEHWEYAMEVGTPLSDFVIEDLERDINPIKSGGQRNSTYFGCMTKLWNRGAVAGRRHQDLMRHITYWRHVGLTAEQSWELGVAWTQDTDWGLAKAKKEVGKMVNWAYETAAYHHSCSTDKVMTDFCVGSKCPIYKHRHQQTKAEGMEDAMKKYREALLEDHGGFNLSEIYGDEHPYSIRAGEVALLLADTKIGKSSLFLNWATKLDHLKWLIITPEMKVEDMVERTMQIKYGLRVNDALGINEVADLAIKGNGSFDRLLDKVNHIRWITSPPYLNDMGRIIAQEAPDVVVIDPLEMVHMKDGDEKSNKLADGIRTLANEHRVPLLIVHHINKDGQREGGSIQPWMSKGFKRIQEQVDHMWAFEGTHDSPFRKLRKIFSRRPQTLSVPMRGDVDTFRFNVEAI